MIRLMKYRSFQVRAVILLLPLISFVLAGITRFGRELWACNSSTNSKESIPPGILHGRLYQGEGGQYFFFLLLTMVVWSIVIEYFGVGSMQHVMERTYVRFAGIRACAMTYLIVLALLFFLRSPLFSRAFIVMSCAYQTSLTIATLAIMRVLHKRRIASGQHLRVLIIGADKFAKRIAKRLCYSRILRCSIVGYLRLEGQPIAVDSAQVLEFDQVKSLAFGAEIDDIIVAIPSERLPDLVAIRDSLSSLPIPLRAVLDLGPGVQLEHKMFRFGNLQMLDLHSGPSESLIYLWLKRVFDIAFASVGIVLASPIMAIIVAVIRITSSGPVLFSQERVGLNGRIFRMYKFRSMTVSTATESDVRWTVNNDPRCTAFGRFLRRSSLDELPQFFNVLKGEMSVVGPRPERPHFVREFGNELRTYHLRHQLHVGITGWAQVNGLRGDSSISERLAHDLYYLQNWSLGFDLQIIFLTMLRGLFGKNAY